MTVAATSGLQSYSQLSQDFWVIRMTGRRSGGHFVEIGSSDGVHVNNTYLLESQLGWHGVCVEPNPEYYESLMQHRTAKIFQRAVFNETGKTVQFVPHGELGTIKGFEDTDFHGGNRVGFLAAHGTIEVETINPNDLFEQSATPPLVDYLSLDTEGSEWDILKAIDFSRYKFGLMTIEHNYAAEKREMIYQFLKGLGYIRLSALFDDWYYHPGNLDALNGDLRIDFQAVISDFMAQHQYGDAPP
jgi:FkbM family methyltransferase